MTGEFNGRSLDEEEIERKQAFYTSSIDEQFSKLERIEEDIADCIRQEEDL